MTYSGNPIRIYPLTLALFMCGWLPIRAIALIRRIVISW